MALENYSRGQKIFMVTLVVFLAALFTVTGAMMAFLQPGGATVPPDQGTINGEAIRWSTFRDMQRALGIVARLDRGATPSSPDAPEHMYARVPTMSVRADYGHDWPYNAVMPRETSLLDVWPAYQDQYVWCHIVLAKRAEEAGIERPSPEYVGRVITALMNQNRQEIDKFDRKDLKARFERTYNSPIDKYFGYFQEAIMVRDYVESQLADERASLDDILEIARGDHEEVKAEYARLKVDYFIDRARREVEDEYFRHQASEVAGGFGMASLPPGYDRFEEAWDKNRAKSMFSDATFGFDVIYAYPEYIIEDGNVEIDDSLLELIYEAVRDEMYKATEADKKNIDARLEQAVNRYVRDNPDETQGWGQTEIDKWKKDNREDYLEYLSFNEARPDLVAALEDKESLRATQTAVAGLMYEIEEKRKETERKLNAQLEVTRKEQEVWDGLRSYLEDVRRRFDSIETQLHAKLRAIGNRIDTQADGEGTDENKGRALDRIVDDFARELSSLDREQVETLLTSARATTRPLERELNNKRAELEEFELEEKKETDNGDTMTEEEVAAKLEQFRLEIEAIDKKIELRDKTVKQVEGFVDAFRAWLANYELLVRNAKDGELGLRRTVLRELLVEIPTELGAFIREQRDEIVPEDTIDEYRGQGELIKADFEARQRRISKDAADTRDWNFAAMVAKHGLRLEEGRTGITWEQLVEDEKFKSLENVEGARQFLEDPNNAAGSTSDLMAMPGKGYIMLRLKDKQPKYLRGRVEARETILSIAAKLRARELTIDALKDLRRKILDRGWDSAISSAKQKYGAHFEVKTTPWFNDKMDLPSVYSEADRDLLNFSSSPSAGAPDQPFMTRIKDIKPSEGVSEIIPEKRNEDPLKRAENDQWAYTLARVVDRRLVDRRLSEDNLKAVNWGGTPSEIWRNRHLATSEAVRNLINPEALLKDHEIVIYKVEEPEEDSGEEEDS